MLAGWTLTHFLPMQLMGISLSVKVVRRRRGVDNTSTQKLHGLLSLTLFSMPPTGDLLFHYQIFRVTDNRKITGSDDSGRGGGKIETGM